MAADVERGACLTVGADFGNVTGADVALDVGIVVGAVAAGVEAMDIELTSGS